MTLTMKTFVLALATGASAQLAAISWGPNRGDIFGSYAGKLFHKFYTGHDWQPSPDAEILAGNQPPGVAGTPSAISWGEGRLDAFYVGSSDSKPYHRYFDGEGWKPALESFGEDLGGEVTGTIAVTSAGEGLIDLIALGAEHRDCVHKHLDGGEWRPRGGWESLGGPAGGFLGDLATVRLDKQLHVFGVAAASRSMLHLYWSGDAWVGWEDLGGAPLAGPVSASSWAADRFDVWAVGADGELKHLYFQTDAYSTWESLGGYQLVVAPYVASQRPGAVDLIAARKALGGGQGLEYLYKAYDGNRWIPDAHGWFESGDQTFSGPPAALSWSNTTTALFGITIENKLAFRYWWGQGWFPNDGTWHPLADLKAAAADLPKAIEDIWNGLREQELR